MTFFFCRLTDSTELVHSQHRIYDYGEQHVIRFHTHRMIYKTNGNSERGTEM